MLEARIVTADGVVRLASEHQNSDLFYAIRGGGYGFGVVVSLTVRTHELPSMFGIVEGTITSNTKESGKELVKAFLDFYKASLLGPNWGEQFSISKTEVGYNIDISMLSTSLAEEEVKAAWEPMKKWVEERQDHHSYEVTPFAVPAKYFWNASIEIYTGGAQPSSYDPLEPKRGFFWNTNVGEISKYWMYYVSRWLRMDQILHDLHNGTQILLELVDVAGSLSVHTNKAQFGATQWAVDELAKTPMHPSIKDSFGLMIKADGVQHYSPLVDQSLQNGTSNIREWLDACGATNLEECSGMDQFNEGVKKFRAQTPGAGAYFNEADYFEEDFHDNFWGTENYQELLRLKTLWDPNGMFYCHNCVGSEEWEEGGMCRRGSTTTTPSSGAMSLFGLMYCMTPALLMLYANMPCHLNF